MDDIPTLTTNALRSLFYKKIKLLNPTTFVEVGPFEGETSKHISEMLPNTKIYAYEANPYNYNNFKYSIESYGVKYKNIAISDSKKTASFFLQKKNNNVEYIKGSHSLLKRSNDKIEYEEVSVKCDTLDNLNYSNNEKYGLWLDAEGHNYNVLKGSINVLKQTEIIHVEVEKKKYWKDQKLDVDVIKFLLSLGFSVLAKDQEYPKQYNIIFIRN